MRTFLSNDLTVQKSRYLEQRPLAEKGGILRVREEIYPELKAEQVDEFFRRQWTPLIIRYDIDKDGNYIVFDAETNQEIQTGWMAPGRASDEIRRVIFQNLRDGAATIALQGDVLRRYIELLNKPEIVISTLIIPEKKVREGLLIASTSIAWKGIVAGLSRDWSKALELSSDQWEELIAGAYHRAGYSEVILTPRTGDHGRDVIAIQKGIGSIKIIGSVKAYKPGLLVSYDHIRALIGTMTGEQNVSKGIITTTSDFPPKVMDDPFIKPFIPYRLELMNGEKTQQWLKSLIESPKT
jgi:restriction system protein